MNPSCATTLIEVLARLGIQGPRYVRPAEILLARTQEAGYETCVTPWTVEELHLVLNASRDFLRTSRLEASYS